jgi:hypothetical protein
MTAVGLTDVKEVILEGEALHHSGTVITGAVTKGQLLKINDAGIVEPATAGARVVGVALDNAEVGEPVTYAVGGTRFAARMILAESQTVSEGDALTVASSSISGVTYLGQVGKATDTTFTTGGAKGTELDAFLLQMRGFVGYALEDKTTAADTNKVIKVLFVGANI